MESGMSVFSLFSGFSFSNQYWKKKKDDTDKYSLKLGVDRNYNDTTALP